MAVNGLYIVQGELNSVVALLRRAHRSWVPSHQQIHQQPSLLDEQDPLLRNFSDLREVLNSVADLADMAPNTFLSPFLDVVRSEQTSGPVTGQALSSVGKFLSYGLVDPTSMTAASAVENIADAVTHARFVGGTDTRGDEVVLLKILQVLRTLLLTPVGSLLTNEAVCEVMQSCFRICFEVRLSELLRKAAESTLADMIQLLFTRLPTFKEDLRHPYIRKLKMRASGGYDGKRHRYYGKKKAKGTPLKSALKTEKTGEERSDTPEVSEIVTEVCETVVESGNEGEQVETKLEQAAAEEPVPPTNEQQAEEPVPTNQQQVEEPLPTNQQQVEEQAPTNEQPAEEEPKQEEAKPQNEGNEETSPEHVVDFQAGLGFASDDDGTQSLVQSTEQITPTVESAPITSPTPEAEAVAVENAEEDKSESNKSRVNNRGVRFKTDLDSNKSDAGPHIPYGLPCVREVLRFLVSLTTPLDRANTEQMIVLGLNLLTVALEAGADYLGSYSLLMPLIRNELARSLLSLLDVDRLPVFASALRLCFLLFESLRGHLKFQLEMYLQRLMAIIVSETAKISFEQKEMALEALDQLWRIPGLVTELYLNYDCDLYCSNVFEEITALLSKNAYPVAALHSTHILSLDALLTVVDTIDINCIYRSSGKQKQTNTDTTGPTLELPAASGYAIGKEITEKYGDTDAMAVKSGASSGGPTVMQGRANRMPLSERIPSHEQVIAQKKQKKLLTQGTEIFNHNPGKGIAFLQEHGLLQSPLVAEEVVGWLKENPRLSKQKIAEYIASRKNAASLEAFVKSFPFEGARIDESLRLFLETFRLPGEAAEISMIMTHFADHWFMCNDEPFNDSDAAFTLSYAVIMLNTDQHNPQVKRNQPPMTVDCFKRNLSGCNKLGDFDQDMLDEIYHAIKSDEIVMPAEQTGQVKEDYQWKVLLRRGAGMDGQFMHAPSGWNDYDLFSLIWRPTIAALSFVFANSDQETILQKSLSGFRKCASIAAHYGLSEVFDNLLISLCKFSTLMGSGADTTITNIDRSTGADNREPHLNIAIAFGENQKAQMAARVLFQLVHNHGDILREAWKNILECLLQLYKARLLPKTLIEVEDFVDPKGWVSIIRKPVQKNDQQRSDSGLLSSLVFYLGGSGPDMKEPRPPTNEEQEMIKLANCVISECHPEQLVTDSKYLTSAALEEFFKALVMSSSNVIETDITNRTALRVVPDNVENALVFYLELMMSVALENKDRLPLFWPTVQRHVQSLLADYSRNKYLIERAVVGLLRLTNRNLFRIKEDISDEVLHSLSILTMLRPSMVFHLSQQISCGLHELLRNNAANVHRRQHWAILFSLLEAAGAAFTPTQEESPNAEIVGFARPDYHSDSEQQHLAPMSRRRMSKEEQMSDRGYTSDSEVMVRSLRPSDSLGSLTDSRAESAEWMYVDHSKVQSTDTKNVSEVSSAPVRRFAFDKTCIVLRRSLGKHEPRAFLKCCETLAFLVRDAAHITPENFESCVQCLRTFVEASLDGSRYASMSGQDSGDSSPGTHPSSERRFALHKTGRMRHSHTSPSVHQSSARTIQHTSTDDDPSQEPTLSDSYHQVSHQLLDLCHTLHVKAAGIFGSWASADGSVNASGQVLWTQCWRPLLQCMARLCCDCRRQIRTQAINYLGRAFLIHDLQVLGPEQWEDCFAQVLLPLLTKLLDNVSPMDPLGMEETRMRATALLSKVLLNHLDPLCGLATFPSLWLTILDFMERYLHTDRSEGTLCEAIPESLKNMILVLDNSGMFLTIPGLYDLTRERLSEYLPELIEEVLPKPPADPAQFPAPIAKAQAPVPQPPPPTHDVLEEVVVTGKSAKTALLQDTTHAMPIILHPPAAPVQSPSPQPPEETPASE